MTSVYIVVEGQTELAFVKSVMAPHLEAMAVFATPIVVSTKRERDGRKHRGGGDWGKWEADLRRLCRDGRPDMRITTLFDLYGLPKNFPALTAHAGVGDTQKQCELLEAEMAKVIGDRRFIPYLQRHEFEALVLAGLPALELILEEPADRSGLLKLEADIANLQPEDINNGRETARFNVMVDAVGGLRHSGTEPGLGVSAGGLSSPACDQSQGTGIRPDERTVSH